jgi:hypothetical protein
MTKRRLPMAEHADTLSLKALRELVTGLVERADRADIRIESSMPKTRSFVTRTPSSGSTTPG